MRFDIPLFPGQPPIPMHEQPKSPEYKAWEAEQDEIMRNVVFQHVGGLFDHFILSGELKNNSVPDRKKEFGEPLILKVAENYSDDVLVTFYFDDIDPKPRWCQVFNRIYFANINDLILCKLRFG